METRLSICTHRRVVGVLALKYVEVLVILMAVLIIANWHGGICARGCCVHLKKKTKKISPRSQSEHGADSAAW